MTGRHSRPTHDGQGRTPEDLEAEATATATIIDGLCWRLRRQEILEHPKVSRGLSKLEEQIAVQLLPASTSPGRHRTSPGDVPGRQTSDADGYDLKPNPLTATTAEEFIGALWQYKAWSGDPSWRRMAAQAGQAVVHSTMYAAMNGKVLPKYEVVRAIIIGCGGNEDDLRKFTTAWRRIAPGRMPHTRLNGRFHAAPLPARQLIPAGEP